MELHKPFAEAFSADKLTLLETDHWVVLVRGKQVTLGSLVLAAKRNFISAGEMTEDEAHDFPVVVNRLESILENAFQFDKINYLCLMMVDRHYHFHVIPRYESQREFDGKEWTDSGWPSLPDMNVEGSDMEMLIRLRDHLKSFDQTN